MSGLHAGVPGSDPGQPGAITEAAGRPPTQEEVPPRQLPTAGFLSCGMTCAGPDPSLLPGARFCVSQNAKQHLWVLPEGCPLSPPLVVTIPLASPGGVPVSPALVVTTPSGPDAAYSIPPWLTAGSPNETPEGHAESSHFCWTYKHNAGERYLPLKASQPLRALGHRLRVTHGHGKPPEKVGILPRRSV